MNRRRITLSALAARALARLETALDRTWSMDAADAALLLRCW